jgi:hypothetical protein
MQPFTDVHHLPGGVTVEGIARARLAGLQTQAGHDVRYLRYWAGEQVGLVFCLAGPPAADAAAVVHRHAHGMVAGRTDQVREGS